MGTGKTGSYLVGMKRDIENREDIRRLIDAFYAKVRGDSVIGYFFNEVARVDWEHHLPVMVDFWDGVLFQRAGYTGNPILTHVQLNQKSPLKKEHFDQWKKLFLEAINENFEGEKAEMIGQRAQSIATVMQIKIAAQAV